MNRRLSYYLTFSLLLSPFVSVTAEESESLTRLKSDVEFLASDTLEGRGPGTEGLAKAAEFIREDFRKSGLESGTSDGSYFQPFEINLGAKVIPEETRLTLNGPNGQVIELKLNETFQAFFTGKLIASQLPIVFAGYGISAPDLKYDDYLDADVEGKVVLIIRREPQQDQAHSVFGGTETSPHSFLMEKVKQAFEHKAAGVLLVNDPFTVAKDGADALIDTQASYKQEIPFAQVKTDIVDSILAATPLTAKDRMLRSVKEVEANINEFMTPLTQPLPGWTVDLQFGFKDEKAQVVNVIGVLKGEGPKADECIVIGAHYDHLGYGGFGSRRPSERAIHNGADDNASGTAALLEVARRFAARSEKPARTVVFIGFSGEERGLLGSSYYVNNPIISLDKTIAMLNFDMIGNLRNNELGVHGTGSGDSLNALIEETAKDEQIVVTRSDGVMAASDHYSFYQKRIPVAFFFTGLTDLYHTPDDDAPTLNIEGIDQVVEYADELAWTVANVAERPKFVEVSVASPGRGSMSYLGVKPDYTSGGTDGVIISGVNPGSPAEKIGLKDGDRIQRIGEVRVADIEGLAEGLTKYKPGETVEIQIKRADVEMTLTVTLGEPGNKPK